MSCNLLAVWGRTTHPESINAKGTIDSDLTFVNFGHGMLGVRCNVFVHVAAETAERD